MKDSRRQHGFTLIELSIVVGLIGLMALGVMSVWSALSRDLDMTRVMADVEEIAAAMQQHAKSGQGGAVVHKLYAGAPDYGKKNNTYVDCGTGEFNIIGVQLRVPDVNATHYQSAPGQYEQRHYPAWVHRLTIRKVPLNAHTQVFANPFSGNAQGYDIETDMQIDCVAAYTYPIGITRWRLKIYQVPADLEEALLSLVRKMPGAVSASHASGTITATFDERAG